LNICNDEAWWLRLLPLLAATVAVGTDAWVVAGFLPALAHDMAATTSGAGLSVTVFAVAYALGAPLLAATTSTVAPRRVISAALVILAAANILCAVSGEFTTFLAGRVLAALAASVVTPSAGLLAARVAGEQRRGRALALVVSGLTIATAVGVPVGSAVAAVTSWRTALLAVAGLAALAAALILATAPNPAPGARQSVRDPLAPLGHPRVLAILALTVLGMTAAYVPYAYIAQLLPIGRSGWLVIVLTAYGIGAVAGSLASGALTDRFGPGRTLTGAYALMTVSFVVMAFHPPAVAVAFLATAWGAASWMQTPPQQHRLLTTAPEHGAVTIGTNASALYAGIAIGNAGGGLLLAHGTALMCLGAAGAAAAALAWNLALTTRTHRSH
jgi:predicted MFS family arabinose efflux permease